MDAVINFFNGLVTENGVAWIVGQGFGILAIILGFVSYQLTWQNYTSTSDFTANGVIATLTFKIKDSATNGKYDIGVY